MLPPELMYILKLSRKASIEHGVEEFKNVLDAGTLEDVSRDELHKRTAEALLSLEKLYGIGAIHPKRFLLYKDTWERLDKLIDSPYLPFAIFWIDDVDVMFSALEQWPEVRNILADSYLSYFQDVNPDVMNFMRSYIALSKYPDYLPRYMRET